MCFFDLLRVVIYLLLPALGMCKIQSIVIGISVVFICLSEIDLSCLFFTIFPLLSLILS